MCRKVRYQTHLFTQALILTGKLNDEINLNSLMKKENGRNTTSWTGKSYMGIKPAVLLYPVFVS